MKSIKAVIVIALLAVALARVPSAQAEGETCTNQYGSTVECPPNRLVINKKVRHPTNVNLFVENLTANDTAYSPNSEVEYDIAVTNTSNVNYETVTIIDFFPSQVVFVSGPGRYEVSGNKLTYELSNLNAGQTVHNRVLVKVKDASVFPQDLTCDVVNRTTVTGPGNQSDEDSASLCVQTKVLGVTTLPVAGFEDYAFMVPFLALAIIGFGILAKGAIRP
jgi:uncharacterized repeat protein (TIGR01451 family)